MVPVLFGVSAILYTLFSLAPGDVVTSMVNSNPEMSEERIAQLRAVYDLDKSLPVRYAKWVGGVLGGDLGESYKYKLPVAAVINTYMWNSFWLAVAALAASVLLAVPLGVLSATRQYSLLDSAFTVAALAGISVPSFFLAMLLIKWFAVSLPVFPVGGMYTTGSDAQGLARLFDGMYHMVLPFMVLTYHETAVLMRYMRTSMLEVIRQDYVRTARAKGLSERVVIYKHALRNALIPLVTILGLSLPGLFSGALITETVFNWPGIGPVILNAVQNRDYPLLMGINMFLAFMTMMGNLLADITYAWVDPRIRYR